MGFFSFITQDTRRSIPNAYQSGRPQFSVTMTDDKGNRWTEAQYEGYGVIGGKDYYQLLAEMNGLTTREEGIGLAYSGNPYKAPNLSESPTWAWIDEAPKDCPDQGFFYE